LFKLIIQLTGHGRTQMNTDIRKEEFPQFLRILITPQNSIVRLINTKKTETIRLHN